MSEIKEKSSKLLEELNDSTNINLSCFSSKNIEMKNYSDFSRSSIDNYMTLPLCSQERQAFIDEMRDNVDITQAAAKVQNVYLRRVETKVSFNYFLFFKFFIYHIVYFFGLGPLTGVILIPFEGYNMVRNMGFLGISYIAFIQLCMYLVFITYPVIIIIRKILKEETDFSMENNASYCFTIFLLFIRSLIIAARYGYTDSKSLEFRYQKEVPNILREFVVTGWRQVDTETLDIEISDSLVRNEIEVEMFKFNLLAPVNKIWFKLFTMDDFHIREKEDMKKLFKTEGKNKFLEKLLLETMKKNSGIDMKIYSRLTPFLKKIKIGKKISLNNSKKNSLIFENKSNISEYFPEEVEEEKYLNINETSENKTYMGVVKKIARQWKSLSDFSDRRIKYPLPQELLPFDKRTPELDIFHFDFPGIIFSRIILYNTRIKSSNLFITFMTIIILIHTILPYLIKIIGDSQNIGFNKFFYYFITPIKIFSMFYLLYFSMLFIETGFTDFSRRLVLMKSLSSMITPDKTLIEKKYKVIPTINFFCAKNLKSWMTCRRLMMDVGLRYQKRVAAYTGIIIIVYSIIVIILLFGNFGILNHFEFKKYPTFFFIGYSQAFILGLVIFKTLLLGVKLNEYHEKHKSEFLYIKSSFNYILLNWKTFLDMTTYVNPYLHKAKEMYFLYKEYHKKVPMERIEIDDIEGKHMPRNDEEFRENLKDICEKIDWIVEMIEQEGIKNPVRMLGIKIDSDFLKDFYIAIITIFYSLFQYIVNTYFQVDKNTEKKFI